MRLAFSRPGLLTFKLVASSTPVAEVLEELSKHWAIRHCGTAIGNLHGQDSASLVTQLWDMVGQGWDGIHVFQRDAALPGHRGFEPGVSELSGALASAIEQSMSKSSVSVPVNRPARTGQRVLDLVIVEPDRWLVGSHTVGTVQSRWPGGSINVGAPTEMVSRAYLKMGEALLWSQLPIEAGDKIVEIGSSPGGAAQRLLDLGLHVTGIDPGEMHPLVLSNPRFRHWRSKSSGVKRKLFRPFRWLAADANVAPNYTLDAVEDIVTYSTSHFKGLLLTLKLSSYELADSFPEFETRIRSWGFESVTFRQLSTNRSECCVAVSR